MNRKTSLLIFALFFFIIGAGLALAGAALHHALLMWGAVAPMCVSIILAWRSDDEKGGPP